MRRRSRREASCEPGTRDGDRGLRGSSAAEGAARRHRACVRGGCSCSLGGERWKLLGVAIDRAAAHEPGFTDVVASLRDALPRMSSRIKLEPAVAKAYARCRQAHRSGAGTCDASGTAATRDGDKAWRDRRARRPRGPCDRRGQDRARPGLRTKTARSRSTCVGRSRPRPRTLEHGDDTRAAAAASGGVDGARRPWPRASRAPRWPVGRRDQLLDRRPLRRRSRVPVRARSQGGAHSVSSQTGGQPCCCVPSSFAAKTTRANRQAAGPPACTPGTPSRTCSGCDRSIPIAPQREVDGRGARRSRARSADTNAAPHRRWMPTGRGGRCCVIATASTWTVACGALIDLGDKRRHHAAHGSGRDRVASVRRPPGVDDRGGGTGPRARHRRAREQAWPLGLAVRVLLDAPAGEARAASRTLLGVLLGGWASTIMTRGHGPERQRTMSRTSSRRTPLPAKRRSKRPTAPSLHCRPNRSSE